MIGSKVEIPQLPALPVVMIDNYDSFTYNLVQYLQQMGLEVVVYRNDDITPTEVMALKPSFLVLSPGPSRPEQAGICLELVKAAAAERMPVLGVCLGHQAIGQAFGAVIATHHPPMHGKTSKIHHHQVGLFAGLPNPLIATRYHSLVVQPDSLPECLQITAQSDDGVIQGLCHKTLPIAGIQFHPESVLTEHGHQLLANFVTNMVKGNSESGS